MANANDFGPGSQLYPLMSSFGPVNLTGYSVLTIDAAGESVHFIGTCYIDGRPAAAKTLSAAGGTISWNPGAITFANAGTTLRIGIQDVDGTNGTPARGDGTHDVYADLVGGTDTITATTWREDAMETGTKDITHGQLITIVFNLESRGGADSIQVRTHSSGLTTNFPTVTLEAPDATFAVQASLPIALITFDDGTLGWIYGSMLSSALGTVSLDVNSAADEIASIFQFSRPTPIDGLWFYGLLETAAGGGTTELILYSDPEGTPAAVSGGTLTLDHEQRSSSGVSRYFVENLPAVIVLSANTKYAVAVRPTSTENVTIHNNDVAAANHLKSMPGGTQAYYGTRAGQTGAFSTTTTRRLWAGVIACGGDDGAGSGGGGAMIGSNLRGNFQ